MIQTTRPSAMKGMTSSPCKRLSSATTRCQSHRPPGIDRLLCPAYRRGGKAAIAVCGTRPKDPGLFRKQGEFARFLENADDVRAFAKLPQPFGFSIDYTDAGMNLRSYYPDFVATDKQEIHWLIETKGMETTDVGHKDIAATNWCENATASTKAQWKYAKIQ